MNKGFRFAINPQPLNPEPVNGYENLKRQHYLRKEVNRLYQNALTCNPENIILNVNQFTACSVMIS